MLCKVRAIGLIDFQMSLQLTNDLMAQNHIGKLYKGGTCKTLIVNFGLLAKTNHAHPKKPPLDGRASEHHFYDHLLWAEQNAPYQNG